MLREMDGTCGVGVMNEVAGSMEMMVERMAQTCGMHKVR